MANRLIQLALLGILAFWGVQAFGDYKQRGLEAYKKGEFDDAIVMFKKHLRGHKTDYNSWDLLAASYYNTGYSGQARKALKIFRKYVKFSEKPSFNYFYQGLCLEILNRKEKAKQTYLKTMKFRDEFADHAMFQTAVVDYHERNFKKAQFWAQEYLSQYPNGQHKKNARKMLVSIKKGVYIPTLQGADKPDPDLALRKYHPLSLSKYFPNFWFLQAGYTYDTSLGKNPNYKDSTLVDELSENHSLNASAAVGAGPFKDKGTEAWFGYLYVQKWLADKDRMTTWNDEPSNFDYFAFRADLLQRHHNLFALLNRKMSDHFGLGLRFSMRYSFVGSSLIPGPDDASTQKVLPLEKSTAMIPWISIEFNAEHRSIFYLLFRKTLNIEEPDFSNKTYATLGDPRDMSLGFIQEAYFPTIRTGITLDLINYASIYNDYWLDRTRQGGALEISHELVDDFFVSIMLAGYSDQYNLEDIRYQSCEYTNREQVKDAESVLCPRTDIGQIIQVRLEWNFSKFASLSFMYNKATNTNSESSVYNSSHDSYVLSLNSGFPGVLALKPFLVRFDDATIAERVNQ